MNPHSTEPFLIGLVVLLTALPDTFYFARPETAQHRMPKK